LAAPSLRVAEREKGREVCDPAMLRIRHERARSKHGDEKPL
jgi:hypothetical protein